CMFNPIKPWQGPLPWTPNHRDHRKLLVVDNEVAFAGGLNISRVYASGSFGRRRTTSTDAGGWRDTHIALRGPVVAPLGRLFQATWLAQQCPGAAVDAPPAAAAQAGERVVQVLAVDPGDRAHRVYRSMMAAIDASQRSVHLTMAYFAPGADMVQALCDAALRGVSVELVLPGKTDFQWILHAGRANYQQLLDAGVRIHELRTSLLHAKTAVIDGVYATVGSSNLDWRSLADNNELNVVVLGDEVDDATLVAMHAAGVRGARLNRVSPVGEGAGLAARLQALAPRLHRLGWHLQWYATPAQLPEIAAWHAAQPQAPVCVLDHLAGLTVDTAQDPAAWHALQTLADQGAWIKLSGWYRLQSAAPFADLQPAIGALHQQFAGRCVWGSDWPHTRYLEPGVPGPVPSYADLMAPAQAVLSADAWRHTLQAAADTLYR
ncbi:MAG: hypothetical protein CFE45_25165, partial [Burkholderiales bacterium PBB5]